MSAAVPPSLDIRLWSRAEREYLAVAARRGKRDQGQPGRHVGALALDCARVYALLKTFISPKPNGVYTFLAAREQLENVPESKPVDNLVWWDFLLRNDSTILHVVRTCHVLEAWVHDADGGTPSTLFDPEAFLSHNLAEFGALVDAAIGELERHSVYVNHFRSYQECVEWLWSELDGLDPQPPLAPSSHILMDPEGATKLAEQEGQFLEASRKFHVLAKSLILHCAFMVEACLNAVFRVGAIPELRISPAAMGHCVRSNFREKLRLLQPLSMIVERPPDMAASEVQSAFALMELRNKYVHADESSQHNSLGIVHYDGDYPLLPVTGHTPAVEFGLRAFHRPDRGAVDDAYRSAHEFVEYLLSLVADEYRDDIRFMMRQHHVAFNETRKLYSLVYSATPFSCYVGPTPKDERVVDNEPSTDSTRAEATEE